MLYLGHAVLHLGHAVLYLGHAVLYLGHAVLYTSVMCIPSPCQAPGICHCHSPSMHATARLSRLPGEAQASLRQRPPPLSIWVGIRCMAARTITLWGGHCLAYVDIIAERFLRISWIAESGVDIHQGVACTHKIGVQRQRETEECGSRRNAPCCPQVKGRDVSAARWPRRRASMQLSIYRTQFQRCTD